MTPVPPFALFEFVASIFSKAFGANNAKSGTLSAELRQSKRMGGTLLAEAGGAKMRRLFVVGWWNLHIGDWFGRWNEDPPHQ
jgi:hypothetical protein